MGKKNPDDGVTKAISGLIVGVIVIIAVVPKEVWIALGVIAGAAALIAVVVWLDKEYDKRRAAKAAAAKRDHEEQVQKIKQQRIDTLGKENATLVESALAAVEQVGASEAARAGWLGDVDFTADIREITDKFEKSHALRNVCNELSALNKPSLDDRKILEEAKTTIANLERAAIERVELIGKCATEARFIDKSLRTEREDARTAEQRAELHGKLSAMLYGVDATPDTTPKDSAANAVMARVMAYREIKNQISQARGS